jgi:hypothetical protein
MNFANWEWAVPALMVLPTLRQRNEGLRGVGWMLAPGLLWLGLFLLTGDRRLYFCYTMQYAVQLACLLRARGLGAALGGGSAVIVAFAAVRIWQAATAEVLFVELLVAAAVLGFGLSWYGVKAESAARRALVGLVASLLAFAGLAL